MVCFSRSGVATSLLLAVGCSGQKVLDQSALVQKRLELGQVQCPSGYVTKSGDVAGFDHFGRGEHNKVSTIQKCADDCEPRTECLSFEWSPTTKVCSLNKKADPGMAAFKDYVFCKRTDFSSLDPGYNGFVFERIASGQPPFLEMEIGECNAQGRCIAKWGSEANVTVKTALAAGIQIGDSISGDIDLNVVPQNSSSPWAALFPKPAKANQSCTICTGSCTLRANSSGLELLYISPTTLDSVFTCSQLSADNATSMTGEVLMEETRLLDDLTELQLQGSVTLKTSVLDAAGGVKGEDSFAISMSAPSATAKAQPADRSAASAKKTIPGAVMEMYKRSAMRVLTEAASSPRVAELARTRESRNATPVEHVLYANLTVVEVAGGQGKNLSLASPACTQLVSDGSVVCNISESDNSSYDLNLSLDLELLIEEGARLNVSVTPHAGGLLSWLINDLATALLPKEPMSLPVCGNRSAAVEVFEQVLNVDVPRCGFYKLAAKALLKEAINSKELAIDTKLPYLLDVMGLSVDDFLPLGALADLKLLGKDDSVLAHISVDIWLQAA